jgi:hypothetical protein
VTRRAVSCQSPRLRRTKSEGRPSAGSADCLLD